MKTTFLNFTGLRTSMLIIVIALGPAGVSITQAQLLNGDFSAGKTSFTNDYKFDPSGTYIPGYYSLQTNSQSADYNYVKFGDHTTGTGYMLLADGNTNSSQAVWRETIATTTNTAYAFSAWAASSDAQSPAVLRFLANGTSLGPDFALSFYAGQWQQFIATWNSGTNTQVTLAVVDMNVSYVGNDFALDDLAFNAITNAVAGLAVYPAVELNWPSQAGAIYQVQYSTAANPGRWANVGLPVESTGSIQSFLDSTRNQASKFYRVIRLN